MTSKIQDVLGFGLVIISAPVVLAAFFFFHWTGYICGLVYGIVSEVGSDCAEQFCLGRYHMTGEGGDRR